MNLCYTSPSANCCCSDSSGTKTDTFWLENLRNYDIGRSLSLPTDRQRISVNHRADRVWSIMFNFDSKLSCAFLDYASIMNTTLEYLAFTCYYVFLFKITNGERDLCVGRNIVVRYQSELHDLNNILVNT